MPGSFIAALFIASTPCLAVDLAASDAELTITYGEADGWFGWAGGMLDFDGDGYLDLAVGAPHHSAPDLAHSGETDVFLGPLTQYKQSITNQEAAAVFQGTNENAWQGYTVSSIGDLDDDGVPELAATSLNADERAGLLSIWKGGPREWPFLAKDRGADAIITGDESDEYVGCDVDGGDVDGDGVADLLIGAYGPPSGANRGQVVLVFGGSLPATAPLSELADTTIDGELDGDWAGRAVAVSPDVNGDGYGDLLVGAMEAEGGGPQSGVFYVVYGRPGYVFWPDTLADADAKIDGEAATDFAASGRSVEPLGDVNGDSLGDIGVGAYQNDDGAPNGGKVYLLYGRASGWPSSLADADMTWTGSAENGELGRAVSTAGDLDGDGRNDILVGEPGGMNESGEPTGRAYLLLARDLGTSGPIAEFAAATVTGLAPGDQMGRHVFAGDDLDGDGLPAFGVGAIDAGTVSLFEASSWIDADVDGITKADGDCDDRDPEAFPGAEEACDDGVDQDCDGADLPCPDDTDDTDTDPGPCGCGGEANPGALTIVWATWVRKISRTHRGRSRNVSFATGISKGGPGGF